MLTVFADRHLFKIEELVPGEIDLQLYDPDRGLPEQLDEADALLIRTVTPVNAETLAPVPPKLKFVASGSAGTDHVDRSFLERKGIAFSHAAGCNARSVAEYVVTALLLWSDQNKVQLNKETIGIVGVGNVGSALQNLLERLGWSYRLYDPPRSLRESSFKSAELSDLLECSVLTFHTPLTRSGRYQTYYWLDRDKLSNRQFKLVINSSRGGVVEEQALLESMKSGSVGDIIIDVWENEPVFSDEVAQNAFVATPHIAGYSVQSKFRATKMIVDDLIDYFNLGRPGNSLETLVESTPTPLPSGNDIPITAILNCIHPIERYHRELTRLIGTAPSVKRVRFRELRTSLPFRNEYAYLQLPSSTFESHPILKNLI